MTKSKLQKEYVRQLVKQLNQFSGKLNEKSMREMMLIAAIHATGMLKKDKKKCKR